LNLKLSALSKKINAEKIEKNTDRKEPSTSCFPCNKKAKKVKEAKKVTDQNNNQIIL